eukprot:11996438-Alexandrium_andersonii.AAC.1
MSKGRVSCGVAALRFASEAEPSGRLERACGPNALKARNCHFLCLEPKLAGAPQSSELGTMGEAHHLGFKAQENSLRLSG